MLDRFYKSNFYRRNGSIISAYFLLTIAFWSIFLIIIPQLYMLDLSFKPGSVGTQQGVSMENIYTLENYHHFFFGSEASSSSFNTVDMGIFINTIKLLFDKLVDMGYTFITFNAFSKAPSNS